MWSSILLLSCSICLSSSCLAVPPPAPVTPAPTFAPLASCKCGVRGVSRTRIVGGQAAQKNEYPWQVALVRTGSNSPFCGGTLLSDRTVITAAHCATDVSRFQVVVGEHDIRAGDGEQRISPASWTSHPNYNTNTQDNDFAIIQLASPVIFTTAVSPVCLPSSSGTFSGNTATVTGWGTLSSGGSQPNILQEVDVTVASNSQCITGTAYSSGEITSNMLCASAGGKDSCQGDSGGPLVTEEGGAFSLIGVVSWGYGCAQANAPGVYSRVTAQKDWIQGQMRGGTCPKN